MADYRSKGTSVKKALDARKEHRKALAAPAKAVKARLEKESPIPCSNIESGVVKKYLDAPPGEIPKHTRQTLLVDEE